MPYVPFPRDFYKKPRCVTMSSAPSERAAKYYNSPAWTNTRRCVAQEKPLCELSLLQNRVVNADELHHLIKFNEQPTDELRFRLLIDPDNIIGVSTQKHLNIHYRRSQLTEDEVNFLNERKQKVFEKYVLLNLPIVFTEDENTVRF